MAEQQPDTDPPAEAPSPRRGRLRVFAVAAALVWILDVVSKAIVAANLPIGDIKRVLGGVVYLDQERNSGAAFSLGTGLTVVLTIVALAVIVVILRFARRLRSTGWAIALGLVLGGALGNLSDRIFRAPGPGRGHVVDWISLFGPDGKYWPIFNVADSGIVCGAVLAAVLALIGVDFDGRRRRG